MLYHLASMSVESNSEGVEDPNAKNLSLFRSLCACILNGVIAENLKRNGVEDKSQISTLQENLGTLRSQRYQMLAQIDSTVANTANFNNVSRYSKRGVQKNKPLETTFKQEVKKTVRQLRSDFNKRFYPKTTYGLLETLKGKARPNNQKKTEKELNIESVEYFLKSKLILLGYPEEQEYADLKKVAKILYELVLDPEIGEEKAWANYEQNYGYFVLLGNHNNEIAISTNSKSKAEENGFADLGFVTPELPESAVKTSLSVESKQKRGVDINEMSDIYRSTVLIDDIFEDIDALAIMEQSEDQKEYLTKLNDERRRLFGGFFDQKLGELEALGYTLNPKPAIKIYDSGYVDSTIYLEKTNEKGISHKFEMQIQTKATLKAKAKETKENTDRKKLQKEALNIISPIIDSLGIESSKFRKFLEALFITNTSSIDDQYNEIIQRIGEINSEFSISVATQEQIQNLAKFTFENKSLMLKSLKRSKTWFAQQSFIQNLSHLNQIQSFMTIYGKRLDFRVSKNNLDLSEVDPDFSEMKQTTRVGFIRIINGKPCILLLRKEPNSKSGECWELPGGKVDESEIEKVVGARNVANPSFVEAIIESSRREAGEEAQGIVKTQPDSKTTISVPVEKYILPDSSVHPFSYPNPNSENSGPTDVNLVFAQIPASSQTGIQDKKKTLFSMRTGTLPEDKLTKKMGATWVPVSEFIQASSTGQITLNGKILPFNGNTLLPDSVLYRLYEFQKNLK
ncbi:MAG: hypothetical protein WCK98_06870 [bacterium]